MGFSISWYAVREGGAQTLLDRLGLLPTGETEEVPESLIYIFEIPLRVAQTLTGFKHDEICPHMTEEQFVVLSRSAPKKGLIWRLFGA